MGGFVKVFSELFAPGGSPIGAPGQLAVNPETAAAPIKTPGVLSTGLEMAGSLLGPGGEMGGAVGGNVLESLIQGRGFPSKEELGATATLAAVPFLPVGALKATGGVLKQVQQIKPVQKVALQRYVFEGPAINKMLRGIEAPASPQDMVRHIATTQHLDDLTSRFKSNQASKAFRGVSITDFTDPEFAKVFQNPQVGDSFTDKGFTSLSTNPTKAQEFAGEPGASQRLLFTVDLPSGQKFTPVEEITQQAPGGANELILPRNTTFTITKIEEAGNRTNINLKVAK
jgi:hypothetical protein